MTRRKELEPNVSVMKCAREVKLCAHSCALAMDVLVGVRVVKRHAIVDVQCVLVIRVVIGVHFVVLWFPLVVVHVVPIFLVVQFIQLFSPCPFFTYVFTVFSRHFRCGIYISWSLHWPVCFDAAVKTWIPFCCFP